MDNHGVDTTNYNGRRIRGTRKSRATQSLGLRFLRNFLVCVCGLSTVGGFLLLRQIASPKLQFSKSPNELDHRNDVPIPKTPSVDFLKLEGEYPSLKSGEKKVRNGQNGRKVVSRVGFGSCTSRVAMEQPIWAKGVIPSDIEAWIWFAQCVESPRAKYCTGNDFQNNHHLAGDGPTHSHKPTTTFSQYHCIRSWCDGYSMYQGLVTSLTWIGPMSTVKSSPLMPIATVLATGSIPISTHAYQSSEKNWATMWPSFIEVSGPDGVGRAPQGDITHASFKLQEQLRNPDYEKFVEFMCPTARLGVTGSLDLSLCERPILGTWDDHDYSWQAGDKRMPTKEELKHLWLDAFGVPQDSPRRSKGRGIYWRHTLNEGIAGKEIDVLLLDERFHRDTKPCHTRRDVCKFTSTKKTKYIWCKDFLQGGDDGKGSCCKKDDQIWQGWCKLKENRKKTLWEHACNPKSQSYGSVEVAVDSATKGPVLRVSSENGTSANDSASDGGVLCEVLGPAQRNWLQKELNRSGAALKLVVSGSPLFSNPTNFVCSKARRKRPAAYCSCFDDFDCFQPAQQNLLHTIAAAPGCVVVLTGDFHFSDIKVLEPGKHNYSNYYNTIDLPRPVVQVMASGLTTNTALPAPCQGFRVDKVGLRPNGACDFVSGPAFGMIEVDWESSPLVAKVQIRGDGGKVLLEEKVSLDTCQFLKKR